VGYSGGYWGIGAGIKVKVSSCGISGTVHSGLCAASAAPIKDYTKEQGRAPLRGGVRGPPPSW
jgi:hypothetical protein